MATEHKYIDLKEFRDFGFLQEVNRKFFHPLGLALVLSEDTETGAAAFVGIWDARDDPEGIMFDEAEWRKNAKEVCVRQERVQMLRESKFQARDQLFDGEGATQPLPED
jgi:hypothetical protein